MYAQIIATILFFLIYTNPLPHLTGGEFMLESKNKITNFAFKQMNPTSALLLDEQDVIAEIRDLRLYNVRFQPQGAIVIGESVPMPLFWWQYYPDNDNVGWRVLPLDLSLGAGGKKNIRLGVRRAGLIPDQLYEANLEVVGDTGMRIFVPASVKGISHAGLWVGSAKVNKVNEARVDSNAHNIIGGFPENFSNNYTL